MKIFLVVLFAAAAIAAPAPMDDEIGEPVELIVNGLAEGEALEIGDVLGIKVKEHVGGSIVAATDLLHPLTAAGLEEAAAADIPEPIEIIDVPEVAEIKPEPVELPPPVMPELVPEPIVLPEPVLPEIEQPAVLPDSIVLPAPVMPEIEQPALLPESIVLPAPVMPEIEQPALLPEAIVLPAPVVPEIQPPVSILPAPVEVPETVLPEVPAAVDPEPVPQLPIGEVFNNGLVQVHVNTPEPGVVSTIQSWFNMVINYFNGSAVTTHQIV